jgi:hypothetical protein
MGPAVDVANSGAAENPVNGCVAGEDSVERDDFSSNRRHTLTSSLSMIFSENRYPPRIKCGAGFFGIML